MNQFLNPDNSAFAKARNSKIYVDKSGLIEYTNEVGNTSQCYICNSRPRRFGKSYTADMLTAYYSKGCDSRDLFTGLTVSMSPDFEKYLNKYDVIHLDIQWFWTTSKDRNNITDYITGCVLRELVQTYPDVDLTDVDSLSFALSRVNSQTGNRFIIIIDEWDFLIRDEYFDKKAQEEYINFLRSLFKGTEPSRYLQLAYITGILPVVRIKTQSALNNFDDFTMLYPDGLASYFGFTEAEVKKLCTEYGRDFEKVKSWYDGYLLGGMSIYNPRAVVGVMQTGEFRSYWSETGSWKTVVPLINRNFAGLKTAIITMLSGSALPVNVGSFENNPAEIRNRDEVITYLIHLGYLGYNQVNRTAFVPNEEIRQELTFAVEDKKWDEFQKFQEESENLLDAVLEMDSGEVAQGIEKIHEQYVSAVAYNWESSLGAVVTIGFLATMEYYFKPIQEMPAGRGFADFVYLPKPEYRDSYPALIVELKWNRSAQTALNQIKDKHYPESVKEYTGDMLLIGINYDKKTKVHTCGMEKVRL